AELCLASDPPRQLMRPRQRARLLTDHSRRGRSSFMRNALAEITNVDLEYLDRIHPALSRVLSRMDREGGDEHIPVVGTAVGRFLRVLTAAIRAKRVLEIGTAIGYSAIWIGGALPRTGELVTIDPDVERTNRAKR